MQLRIPNGTQKQQKVCTDWVQIWDKIVPTYAQSSWYDVPKTPTREKLDFWENTVFCYAVRWWKTENRKSRNCRKVPIRNGRDPLFFFILLSRPFPYRETIFLFWKMLQNVPFFVFSKIKKAPWPLRRSVRPKAQKAFRTIGTFFSQKNV